MRAGSMGCTDRSREPRCRPLQRKLERQTDECEPIQTRGGRSVSVGAVQPDEPATHRAPRKTCSNGRGHGAREGDGQTEQTETRRTTAQSARSGRRDRQAVETSGRLRASRPSAAPGAADVDEAGRRGEQRDGQVGAARPTSSHQKSVSATAVMPVSGSRSGSGHTAGRMRAPSDEHFQAGAGRVVRSRHPRSPAMQPRRRPRDGSSDAPSGPRRPRPRPSARPARDRPSASRPAATAAVRGDHASPARRPPADLHGELGTPSRPRSRTSGRRGRLPDSRTACRRGPAEGASPDRVDRRNPEARRPPGGGCGPPAEVRRSSSPRPRRWRRCDRVRRRSPIAGSAEADSATPEVQTLDEALGRHEAHPAAHDEFHPEAIPPSRVSMRRPERSTTSCSPTPSTSSRRSDKAFRSMGTRRPSRSCQDTTA